jgi:hypothetical protein
MSFRTPPSSKPPSRDHRRAASPNHRTVAVSPPARRLSPPPAPLTQAPVPTEVKGVPPSRSGVAQLLVGSSEASLATDGGIVLSEQPSFRRVPTPVTQQTSGDAALTESMVLTPARNKAGGLGPMPVQHVGFPVSGPPQADILHLQSSTEALPHGLAHPGHERPAAAGSSSSYFQSPGSSSSYFVSPADARARVDREMSVDHDAVMRSALRVLNERTQQRHFEEQQQQQQQNAKRPAADSAVNSSRAVGTSTPVGDVTAIVTSPNRSQAALLPDAAIVLISSAPVSSAVPFDMQPSKTATASSPRRKAFIRAADDTERVTISNHFQSPEPQHRHAAALSADMLVARDAALALLRPNQPPLSPYARTHAGAVSPALGTPTRRALVNAAPPSEVSASPVVSSSPSTSDPKPLVINITPVMNVAAPVLRYTSPALPLTPAVPTFVHAHVPNTLGVWGSPTIRKS